MRAMGVKGDAARQSSARRPIHAEQHIPLVALYVCMYVCIVIDWFFHHFIHSLRGVSPSPPLTHSLPPSLAVASITSLPSHACTHTDTVALCPIFRAVQPSEKKKSVYSIVS